MNIERHVFEPSTVASLSGVTVDTQRDWRHKDLIKAYGSVTNTGRWKYSFRDAVGFWLASRLVSHGWDRGLATKEAWLLAPEIIAIVQGKEPKDQFMGFVIKGSDQQPGVTDPRRIVVPSLGKISGPEFERLDLLNLKALAAAVPDGIREFATDVESI